MRIAALLTCFNRKSTTIECIERLIKQAEISSLDLTLYVVDDGSSDGTADAIRSQFPKVELLIGDGTLFWNRGMHKAFAAAIKKDFDFYLWVNDDTLLYDNAIVELIEVWRKLSEKSQKDPVLVGATCTQHSAETTYGGYIRSRWWSPLKFSLVPVGSKPTVVEAVNGNCVLIPRAVVESIGNLDPVFHHYLGDFDYSLRALKAGHTVWLAPMHVGTCELSKNERINATPMTIREGLRKLNTAKGLNVNGTDLVPFAQWKAYCQRHGGMGWVVFWLAPYRRLLKLKWF